MSQSVRVLSAMVAIATISCATSPAPRPHSGEPATVAAPADPRVAGREAQTRALVAEVAKVRGLPELKRLDISFEDKETFKRSIARAAAEDKSDPEVERAMWVAFGFAGPEAQPKEIALKVLDEQVAAFYDSKEKRLHVPLDAPEGMGAQADQAAEVILAHEIEHGLQDQHFPIPDLDQQPDEDTAVALKALYEGDATFVMIAVPAARQGTLDGVRMLSTARQLRALPMSVLESMSGKQSPELQKAPKLIRAELLFPYFGGMLLLAELYRAGGFRLIDRLFEHPAVSSEQVLHPEKYVAGEQPVPVAPPELLAGTRELARGRLGELYVRTMLGDCLDDTESAKGAEGWGGDAFLVAARADGAMSLQWSTTWDNEAAAARFESALRHAVQAGCFAKVEPIQASTATGAVASTWSLPAGAAVRRDGRAVSMVRGFSREEEQPRLAHLLTLPGAPLPNAPRTSTIRLGLGPG